LDSNFTEEVLENQPAKELGAPPRELAAAGRMNVEYIPAFYGAFSEETAVAEMRPGIGERVAIGEFILRKDVKVFDFTVFSRAPREEQSKHATHTRFDFIEQMEREISRRVLPYEKQLQYISTQVVAEYLKEYFGCEAVIYGSSVVTGSAADGRNIVFLPRAEDFVGVNMSILKYRCLAIKKVRDVHYELVEDLF
jgi:RES domain